MKTNKKSQPVKAPSHSYYNPSVKAMQKLYIHSTIAMQEGTRYHNAVANFVNDRIPMSSGDYAKLEPLLSFMKKRGFVPSESEVSVKGEGSGMKGKIDLIFERDFGLRPEILENEFNDFVEVIVELKTKYLWLFDTEKSHSKQDIENIKAIRISHIRQVCCYMKMRTQWWTGVSRTGGCIYYVDLKKIIPVPRSYQAKFCGTLKMKAPSSNAFFKKTKSNMFSSHKNKQTSKIVKRKK